MELTSVVRMGDKELRVKGITLKEMLAITGWTGYENKSEWLQAVQADKPLALQAAYALALWRDTGTKPRLDDVDFDLDTLDTRFVDETGATVVIAFETNADGITLKKNDAGDPVPLLDKEGRLQFRYAETGELVVLRPTAAPAPTTSTRRSSGRSSASRSSTPESATA